MTGRRGPTVQPYIFEEIGWTGWGAWHATFLTFSAETCGKCDFGGAGGPLSQNTFDGNFLSVQPVPSF